MSELTVVRFDPVKISNELFKQLAAQVGANAERWIYVEPRGSAINKHTTVITITGEAGSLSVYQAEVIAQLPGCLWGDYESDEKMDELAAHLADGVDQILGNRRFCVKVRSLFDGFYDSHPEPAIATAS